MGSSSRMKGTKEKITSEMDDSPKQLPICRRTDVLSQPGRVWDIGAGDGWGWVNDLLEERKNTSCRN